MTPLFISMGLSGFTTLAFEARTTPAGPLQPHSLAMVFVWSVAWLEGGKSLAWVTQGVRIACCAVVQCFEWQHGKGSVRKTGSIEFSLAVSGAIKQTYAAYAHCITFCDTIAYPKAI